MHSDSHTSSQKEVNHEQNLQTNCASMPIFPRDSYNALPSVATPPAGKIFSAIAAAFGDVEAIAKDRLNEKQRFNYRGIDDVYNDLHPILARHRIFTAPTVLSRVDQEKQSASGGTLFYRLLTIQYRFFTDDGSFVDVVVVGEGMDSGDKASNKAMAVAHKYALMQIFAIPTEDAKDPDADSHKVITPQPKPPTPRTHETIREPRKPQDNPQGQVPAPRPIAPPPASQPPQAATPWAPGQAELDRIKTLLNEKGWSLAMFTNAIQHLYRKERLGALSRTEYDRLVVAIDSYPFEQIMRIMPAPEPPKGLERAQDDFFDDRMPSRAP